MQTGVVQIVEAKEGKRKRLKIDREFFSYFGDETFEKGDMVQFQFHEEENPRDKSKPYKTIDKIELLQKDIETPEQDQREKLIIRQTCIKAACMITKVDLGMLTEHKAKVLELAEAFEKWVLR